MTEEELVKAMEEAHAAVEKLDVSDPGYPEALAKLGYAIEAYSAHLDSLEEGTGYAPLTAVKQKERGILQTGDMVAVAGIGVGMLELLSSEGEARIHLINGATLECHLPHYPQEETEEEPATVH